MANLGWLALAICWTIAPMVLGSVTVYMNDTQLIYTGTGNSGDSWGDAAYYRPTCGGYRFSEAVGNSVSLNFHGTEVTVNILTDTTHGGIATVIVDGAVLQNIDTSISVSATQCVPATATASNLVDGPHSVTVVQNTTTFIDMQSFVYTPSASILSSVIPAIPTSMSSLVVMVSTVAAESTTVASVATTAPTAASSSSSGTSKAPVIGGVLGGIFIVLVVGVLVYVMKRQPSQRAKTHDLDLGSVQTTPWGYGSSPTPLPNTHGYKEAFTPSSAYESNSSFPVNVTYSTQPKGAPTQDLDQEGKGVNQSQNSDLDRHLLQNLMAHNVAAPAIARVIQLMGGEETRGSGTAGTTHAIEAEEDRAPPPTYDFKTERT
ncbi:hypothetical protein FRB96_002402 [Tulasnella sp. 330]|nr:hypothetical protein FRB96_002402 [Tulasnella sp. 330]KAG8885569.1 hypothetical protein FRB97_000477 [Tulasnella sp. 331]